MSIVESAESNAAFVFEVIVEMSGSEDGQSAPFEVGRPSTRIRRNYSVANHTLVSQEEFLVLTSETFTTPSKPAQMEILWMGRREWMELGVEEECSVSDTGQGIITRRVDCDRNSESVSGERSDALDLSHPPR
ncbi:hypothetical protein BLNAU_14968 [Blattamonas nauphoetae]|uniref:Uncharacterized protein n=1 Tax=Blattamonas nauphoetae TaxID=2049346 RepID=A0ABQ9XC03_9EUKA|nr:hypothetical protein BLNAU_14968 [Blattamonas nauphoetae]